MPYHVVKDGKKYCVEKKEGGRIPGGCHTTREDAIKHMQAIIINERASAEYKYETAVTREEQ